MLEYVRRLGSYRDGILVAASLVYGTGYVAWAIVAWREGIGPIPVLDAQYFAAGLPPLLLIGGALGAGRVAATSFDRWRRYVDQLDDPKPTYIAFATLVLLLIALGCVWLANRFLSRDYDIGVLTFSCAIICLATMATPVETLTRRYIQFMKTRFPAKNPHILRLLERAYRRAEATSVGQRRSILYTAPLLLAVVLASTYIARGYAMLPQALGGARPRCAMIDVFSDKLSPTSLQKLQLKPVVANRWPLQTSRLQVLYVAQERIIVHLPGAYRQTIEIPRSAVAAITSCD
jgi:hypothetical protein